MRADVWALKLVEEVKGLWVGNSTHLGVLRFPRPLDFLA